MATWRVPAVATRVKGAKLSLELLQLGIRKLVRRNLVCADNFAENARAGAEANFSYHKDELGKFNRSVGIRVDLLD